MTIAKLRPVDSCRTSETLSEAASEILAEAIVDGDLSPGSRLHIRQLAEQLGVGPTPLREALAGLAGRGLVTFSGQRGFRVAPATFEDLRDIVRARNVVEEGALRLSITLGDDEWESGIVAALHRLKLFCDNMPIANDDRRRKFEQVNLDFHSALIGACGSMRLLQTYFDLFEQTRRYRSLALQTDYFKDTLLEPHLELADLAIARDVERACKALIEHNRLLLDLMKPRSLD